MASWKEFMTFFTQVLLLGFGDFNKNHQTFDWTVTYKTAAPLGVDQQVIAINGEFPGPEISTFAGTLLEINVHNALDEALLLHWNGIQQRNDSWQDGVLGTNCPILPGQNWTYRFQVTDQIGTFFYFPSTSFQRAAGGFGGIRVVNPVGLALPFAPPQDDFVLLIGDWYTTNHQNLKFQLDAGKVLGAPDGVLINGRGPLGTAFTVVRGLTYRLRISNVGISSTLNFRIQDHRMRLVETEGSYTVQALYDSIDVHVGQTYSVLVTADQGASDFYIVASTRFIDPTIDGLAILHYFDSIQEVSGILPSGPNPHDVNFSLTQAWAIRRNLTAEGPQSNPQKSYKYEQMNVTNTLEFANTAYLVNGRQRFAVNNVSFSTPCTPLKLADHFNITGVFELNSMPTKPTNSTPHMATAVLGANLGDFIEMVFQNRENEMQTWHIDGYNFYIVGFGAGNWTIRSRLMYNLYDAAYRSTIQVYPLAWTAVMVRLDSAGMWNIRSQNLQRQYLGQEFYLRVADGSSVSNNATLEQPIPSNVLLCGKAASIEQEEN